MRRMNAGGRAAVMCGQVSFLRSIPASHRGRPGFDQQGWCGQRNSNPRPSDYKSMGAEPDFALLKSHISIGPGEERNAIISR